MFERFSRGWELAGQSWQVLKRDKELVVFPILSGLACLLVVASFVTPILAIPSLRDGVLKLLDQQNGNPEAGQVLYALFLFAFYFVNYLVIIFTLPQ